MSTLQAGTATRPGRGKAEGPQRPKSGALPFSARSLRRARCPIAFPPRLLPFSQPPAPTLPTPTCSHPLCVNPASDPLVAPPAGGGRGSAIFKKGASEALRHLCKQCSAGRLMEAKSQGHASRCARAVAGCARGVAAPFSKNRNECESEKTQSLRRFCVCVETAPCPHRAPTHAQRSRISLLTNTYEDRGVGHLFRARAPPGRGRAAAHARRRQVLGGQGPAGGQSDGRRGGEIGKREKRNGSREGLTHDPTATLIHPPSPFVFLFLSACNT